MFTHQSVVTRTSTYWIIENIVEFFRACQARQRAYFPMKTRVDKNIFWPYALRMAFKRTEDKEVVRKALEVPDAEVQLVWRAWLHAHASGGRGKPHKLSADRYDTIRAGIVKFGLQQCIKAMYGILYSDWHMGNNPGTKVYNSIELILRDGWRVNRFVNMYESNKNDFQGVVLSVEEQLQSGEPVTSISTQSTVAEE